VERREAHTIVENETGVHLPVTLDAHARFNRPRVWRFVALANFLPGPTVTYCAVVFSD